MECVGKGNRMEAALGETPVAPLYKPPQPGCYSVWLCHPHSVHFGDDRVTLTRISYLSSWYLVKTVTLVMSIGSFFLTLCLIKFEVSGIGATAFYLVHFTKFGKWALYTLYIFSGSQITKSLNYLLNLFAKHSLLNLSLMLNIVISLG